MSLRHHPLTSLRCFLTGHDDREVRDPRRLFLRCGRCGRETGGWSLGGMQAHRRPSADRPRTWRLAGLTWVRSAAQHGFPALFRWHD